MTIGTTIPIAPQSRTDLMYSWRAAQTRASGTQPASVEGVWNFLGYANNAWHRVGVEVG